MILDLQPRLYVRIWHLLISGVLFSCVSCCPKVCQCKWRDGKEWVTCTEANFIDIPRQLEPSTQVLNLERNSLKILFTDAFVDRGLLNLQKVFLAYCKLRKLETGSLRKLANLIELDLSYNFLKEVPSEALSDVPGLRELKMKNNNITYIHSKAFFHTSELVQIDLSYNAISSLDDYSFLSLTKLEVLILASNKLSTMRVHVLHKLTSLHGLYVHANPWNCDCELRSLRRWMLQRNIATSAPPTCSLPKRLENNQWKTLALDEFVCVPQVTAVAKRILASNGDNVSLACRVDTDAAAHVTWLLGNKRVATDKQPRYKVLELVLPEHGSSSRVSNLTIEGADLQDQGTYRCVAENKAGRVETNLTLKVSEVKSEEIVEIDQVFVAGALLGALAFILFTTFIACAVFYKRKRRHAQNLACIMNNSSLDINKGSKRHDPCKVSNQKDYVDYKIVPTSDNENEFAEETEQTQNIDIAARNKHINSNGPTDSMNLSPKLNDSTLPAFEQCRTSKLACRPEDPLLQDLAKQCKDEVLRRQQKPTGSLSTGHFPDLLTSQSGDLQFCTLPRRPRIPRSDSAQSQENPNRLPLNRSSLPPLYDESLKGQNSIQNKEKLVSSLHQGRTPSLPSTPLHPEHPELLWSKRLNYQMDLESVGLSISPLPAFNYEYHANQLDHFLQEYKNLQEELYKMKETAVDAPSGGHDEKKAIKELRQTGVTDWLQSSTKDLSQSTLLNERNLTTPYAENEIIEIPSQTRELALFSQRPSYLKNVRRNSLREEFLFES